MPSRPSTLGRLVLALSLTLAPLAACGPSTTPAPASPGGAAKEDIGALLDGWHEAAARAEEAAYFAYFAPDAVFIGTDPGERWDLEAFRKYAAPRFAKGKAWTMKATRRAISVGPSGDVAWFDEDLDSKGMGAVRASGVLVRGGTNNRWRIVQYNLSVPIPNDALDAVRRVIERDGEK
jgi:ketosteroid isomerase-like protein